MTEAAARAADEVFKAMHAGPIVDVGPERTRRLLRSAILGAMQAARAQAVEDVAMVVERADPPQSAAGAPRVFAAAIRNVFGGG
jgi:hypothetical protein